MPFGGDFLARQTSASSTSSNSGINLGFNSSSAYSREGNGSKGSQSLKQSGRNDSGNVSPVNGISQTLVFANYRAANKSPNTTISNCPMYDGSGWSNGIRAGFEGGVF